MITLTAQSWPDYELVDTGEGLRLERLGAYHIVRPDPNILWPKTQPKALGWQKPDAFFVGKSQKEAWQHQPGLTSGWNIIYKQATFRLQLTPFRHLGIFPEQQPHWQWIQEIVKTGLAAGRTPQGLNLFAYTGAATIMGALAGAKMCHVDAAAGSVNWAKENAALSGLPSDAIRWIVDDVLKFVERELRRGRRYDFIIMDPPVFGRGPQGQIWRLEEKIAQLAQLTAGLLSEQPLGILINFYATALYPESIQRVFEQAYSSHFPNLNLGSLCLMETISKKKLSTGFFLRS